MPFLDRPASALSILLGAASSTIPPTELQSQDADPNIDPEKEITETEGRDGTLLKIPLTINSINCYFATL